MNKKKIIYLLTAILAIAFCAIAFDVRMKTVTYSIDAPEINETVQIALVTDLHSCRYGKNQQNLLDAIDAGQPDIVLLGGDIFDDDMKHTNSEIFVRAVAQKYRCFYVTGNHEFWSHDIEYIYDFMTDCGVTVLRGDCVPIEINGQKLNICGIDDAVIEQYCVPERNIAQQLRAADAAADNGYYTVLLAHRPETIDSYRKYDFDLVLSGHTHGGQWRIPGVLDGFLAPDQGLFPKYSGGRYDFDDATLIISRGLARESTRVPRIFNRPELVFVELC